jgi:ABC-type nitrate/sulfonate/bicarbonate transport system substrate-binding protein
MKIAKLGVGRAVVIGAVLASSLLAAACSSSGSSGGSGGSGGTSSSAASAGSTAAGSSAAAGSTPAAAAASSSLPVPAKLTTVKVGITGATAPPTFPPLIASKMGLDTKNNIKIELVSIAQNVTAQSLTKGAIDVLAAPSVETAILQGAPLKIFAGAALSYWHFVANNSISDWAALKGKKVALPCAQAATCHSFMIDLLKSKGVDANSITFIYGTGQGTYQALAAGSVDAALTTAPYTYQFASSGKTHELSLDGTTPYLSTQFTASESYISKNADVISAFVKTMQEAVADLSKVPTDPGVLSIINDYGKANGIDPTSLDEGKFLTEFATDKSWQLVPTKALIQTDLSLLAAIPATKATASKATFEDLVAMVPEFAGQYG